MYVCHYRFRTLSHDKESVSEVGNSSLFLTLIYKKQRSRMSPEGKKVHMPKYATHMWSLWWGGDGDFIIFLEISDIQVALDLGSLKKRGSKGHPLSSAKISQ